MEKNRDSVMKKRRPLKVVLDDFHELGGVGRPYGVVRAVAGSKVRPRIDMTVRFAFSK